jgi:hypothetical protein
MILPTFTRDEVIKELKQVNAILDERARSYFYYNEKIIKSQLRRTGKYERVFHCEYHGQEYYERFEFNLDGNSIFIGAGSVMTLFNDTKGRFVLLHLPFKSLPEDQYIRGSLELRIFSGHFVERFFERLGINGNGKTLIDKTMVVVDKLQSIVPSTYEDEVIRRHGEPTLTYKFLQEGDKDYECSYFGDGDIAIVERYGVVPVWRTYITKEMLFKSQVDYTNKPHIQEGIQLGKKFSDKIKAPQTEEPPTYS